jgi:cystathionine gamma-synthase
MTDDERPEDAPARAPLTTTVHGGEPAAHPFDALTVPIVQTATYAFADTAALVSYMEGNVEREEYGRYGNPSVALFERRIAELEGAPDAVAFASGMAAITTTIFALVKSGSHVVLFDDCYRRTRQFVTGVLGRYRVTSSLVPAGDLEALAAAIRPETRLIVSEAPTNPYQRVVDLPKLAELARSRRVKTLVDTTFATPINLRALDHGIDLVVHSATKYLGGHNDVLGGVVAGAPGLVSLVRDLRHVLGGILDPHAAWLLVRGLKTLGVRVQHQNATGAKIAAMLEQHPAVARVWYPGLESHPDHAIARRLLRGFGGVVTFALNRDGRGTSSFIDACRIPRIAPSLGGVESLIEQPALMSYFELSGEERRAIGIDDNLVRLALGVEDPDDLARDLLGALDRTER